MPAQKLCRDRANQYNTGDLRQKDRAHDGDVKALIENACPTPWSCKGSANTENTKPVVGM